MKFGTLSAVVLALAVSTGIGCDSQDSTPTIPLEKNSEIPTSNTSRFKIKLDSTFKDNIAYGDKRGVYIITDTKTGKEYVGVSGVGIGELGSHQAGKSTVSDER